MSEQHKTVVITGASSGFGEGAVRAFAERGYTVWGTMRGVDGRNAAKKAALEALSARVSIIDMDVTSGPSVTAAFAQILAQGPVDVLINNAGVMYIGVTEAFSVEQADAQMQTNDYGPTRTVVGIPWGVDALNAATQPIQDRILREMQLEGALGGVSA